MSLSCIIHKALIWLLWSSRTSCITISVSSAWRDPAEPTCWWRTVPWCTLVLTTGLLSGLPAHSCLAPPPELAAFTHTRALSWAELQHHGDRTRLTHSFGYFTSCWRNSFSYNLPVLRVEDEIKQLQTFSKLAPGKSKHAALILTLGRNPVDVWNSRAFVMCTRSSDCWRWVFNSNRAELWIYFMSNCIDELIKV